MYSIDFTENNKKFCLSLNYNGANSDLFVNGTKIHKFKAKIMRLCQLHYAQETFQKTFLQIGLNGHVYDFRVDCDALAVDDLLDVHKYLIEKNNII